MNSSKSWDLEVDSSVLKILKKIPRRNAERLLSIIKALPLNPYAGDIQKMKGEENSWRRRVGNYRIFYDFDIPGGTITVFDLDRRTSTTFRRR